MHPRVVLAIAIGLIFGASFLAKGLFVEPIRDAVHDGRQHARIVSMAPSVTETLFALGLGDRVVGVSEFCDYPLEARRKARVGGYLNPNYEAIVSLRPDLVVTPLDDPQTVSAFNKLELDTLVVQHRNIDGILDSILTIGRACGRQQAAEHIVSDVQARLDRIERRTAGLPRPRVMFCIQRTVGSGRLEDVCIAGSDGHIDRIIELSGGRNAHQHGTVRFPIVSHEGILQMNPQVIVDLAAGLSDRQLDNQTLLADWRQVARTDAVKRGQVYIIADDYAFVPGPRFVLLVEKLARLIHPEIDWEE